MEVTFITPFNHLNYLILNFIYLTVMIMIFYLMLFFLEYKELFHQSEKNFYRNFIKNYKHMIQKMKNIPKRLYTVQ